MTATADRPDPANIVQSLSWIMDALDRIDKEKARPDKMLSMSEAARELGYNDSYFHGRPWRVPDFRTGRWHTLEAYKAWLDRPETERREEWDRMDATERRARRLP